MKLQILAAALQSVYSNGRVKSAKKLDRRDFTIITKAAIGAFMRKVYYEEKSIGSILAYFGNALIEKIFDIEKDERCRQYIDTEESSIVKLPNSIGVFSVTALDNDGCLVEDGVFTRLGQGMDWLYSTSDLQDLGEQTYQILSNRILFKNMTEDTKQVAVRGIFLDDDIDVPEDIAYSIMNDIFTKIVPMQGFPIDKTDDGNPNLIEYKRRLAEQEQL